MSEKAVPLRVRRGYVRIPTGQVHYRTAGSGPPVVLLHYSFLSSTMHLRLIDRLADAFTVVALDTPGYGASAPLELGRRAEIDDFGDALAATIDTLGFESPAVYSSHTSAKFALSCAWRHPGAIGFLVCDGLAAPETPFSDDYIARYMPPFAISADGGHIARNWSMMRDFRRFYPWFEPLAAHRMDVDQTSLQDDHIYGLGLFSAGPHYSSCYGAALRYSPWAAIRGSRTPTVYMAREGDVLAHFLDALEPELPPCASAERLPTDDKPWMDRLAALFGQHAHGAASSPIQAVPDVGSSRAAVAMAYGDLEVRTYGRGQRTILALHDPPGSAASLDALCLRLAANRRVLAPDLPGCGLSDPLPTPDAAAYVDALLALLDRCAVDDFELVAEGFAAPLALALAARSPKRVSVLVLDAALLKKAGEREVLAARYCPPVLLSRQGGHMLDVWQRVRDMELQWPWYDETRTAIRWIDPMVDPEGLHHRMLGILSQLDCYGDACRAALSVDAIALLGWIDTPATILTRPGDPRYPDRTSIPAHVSSIDVSPEVGSPIPMIVSALP
jgi:pimeloyl-ACP methyl ester carboxylesterase